VASDFKISFVQRNLLRQAVPVFMGFKS